MMLRRPGHRKLIVRAAVPGDAGRLVALVKQFSLEDGHPSPLAAAELEELAFGRSPWVGILVAEKDRRLEGYVLYFPSFDTDHAARGFYLQDVYVRPDARGRGIGRQLMAAVARCCLDGGGQYLFWNAHRENRAGRAFYRALGAIEEPLVTLSMRPDGLRALASALEPEAPDPRPPENDGKMM